MKRNRRLNLPKSNSVEIEDEDDMPEKIDEVKKQEGEWQSRSGIEFVLPDRPPVLPEVYPGEKPETTEERDYKLDKAENQEEQLTASMIRELLAERDAQIEKQNLIISELVAKVGALVVPKSAEKDTQDYLDAQTRKLLKERKSVHIIIQRSDNPNLNYPVFVGVNGRNWEIPRGKPVEVPVEVVEVLSHARVDGTQQLVTPEGDVDVVPVNHVRFPFTIWQ